MLVVPKNLFQVRSQEQLGENLVYLAAVGGAESDCSRTCQDMLLK